jgi:hypothetical protein
MKGKNIQQNISVTFTEINVVIHTFSYKHLLLFPMSSACAGGC